MKDSIKVGLFSLVVFAIAAYFVLRIEDLPLSRRNRHLYRVVLLDAQGLLVKSPVLLKGIHVGRVSELELLEDRVMATLSLTREIPLREGAYATVTSVGLLGEKQLELNPGPVQAPPLPRDVVIPASASPSLDQAIGTIGRVGEDVKDVTGNLRGTLGGREGEERLRELVDSVTRLTQQLNRMVEANQKDVHGAVVSVRRMSDAVTHLAKQFSGTAETDAEGTGGSGQAPLAQNLQTAAANLESITGKVERGEGALGRLVGNEETGQKLDRTLQSVGEGANALSRTLSALGQTRLEFQLRGDYLVNGSEGKGHLFFDLKPQASWFLRVGAATQPRGLLSERVTRISTEGPDGQVVTAVQREQVRTGGVGYTVMGGYRYSRFAFRAGLLESRAGLGADMHLLSERIRLTTDAWDFGREGTLPHLRFEGAVYPLSWLALLAGWDDPLNSREDGGTNSFFLGAGLRLR